jgi:hypothetical protein
VSLFKKNQEGQPYFPVKINGSQVELPGVVVGNNILAWLDPRREEVYRSGSREMAKILLSLLQAANYPTHVLLLTPPSKKSGSMMDLVVEEIIVELTAADQNTQVELFNGFVKGQTEAEVREKIGFDAAIVSYQPVTSPDQAIYLGANKTALDALKIKAGAVYIIDDVFSKGETARAIRSLMSEVGLINAMEIPVISLAREVAAEKFASTPLQSDGVSCVFLIPVEPTVAG